MQGAPHRAGVRVTMTTKEMMGVIPEKLEEMRVKR
jgi:hypothetical protein